MQGCRADQLGPQRLQAEPDELAARVAVNYSCPQGHVFDVLFAAEAEELPPVLSCRRHGVECRRVDAAPPQRKAPKVRTHWDMLLERRSLPELEKLLDERIRLLRATRAEI
nr:RNA polymerase-binding protein RbpA [Lentzea sp. NBRC 102530]